MSRASSTHDQWIDRHEALGHYEKVGYVGLGEAYNRWIYELREQHFLRLAGELGAAEASRVLDVGLGNGFYIGLYARLGARDVTGVDLSPRAVELARERFPGFRFEVCDITRGLPESIEPEAGFGWVSVMDTLYHIVEDELFRAGLGHCGAAVAPGGVLVVSDNFPAHTLPATHTQAFHSLDDHLEVLAPLGFELERMSPVFFVSNGQVSSGGLRGAAARAAWRGVSRVLAKTLRVHRPTGERLGDALGAALTTADTLLQQQDRVLGYSTKVAVFRRRR